MSPARGGPSVVAAFLLGALLPTALPARPAAPEVQARGRYARVVGPGGAQALTREVAGLIDAAVPAAARVTGATDLTPVRAVVYAHRGPFSAATGLPRHSAVVGLAVFPAEVIYVDGSGALAPVRRVVPHEVGHVLAHRAAGPGARHMPRWWDEGVAEYLAGPTPAYVDAAALAQLRRGGTLPMAKLEEAFRDPGRMGRAYAESASLVQFLVARQGEGVITSVLTELRAGAAFPAALRSAAGLTPEQLEAAWRESLRARWLEVPDPNVLVWLVMAILVIMAFVRRVRLRRRRQAEWEAAEGEEAETVEDGLLQ